MIILLSGLFIVGIALAMYALIPFQGGEKKPQESPAPTLTLPQPLEQLNLERQNLQTELELANNVARELREELAKFKESAGTQQLQQLKENNEKLQLAQKDNQQLMLKIKALEEQSAVYAREIEKQKAVIQQPSPAVQEQVSKAQKDNQELLQKIKALEEQSAVYLKDIEGQRAVNSDLLNKLKVLEAQLQHYKQDMEKHKAAAIQHPAAPSEEQVPKKKYEELKKKFEEAEQVLRIMHGAGNKEGVK